MKCPKCGFFGPDHLDTCKKCGNDLSAERKKLGLTRLRRRSIRSQDDTKEKTLPAETLREEPLEPFLQAPKPKASPPPPIPLSKEPEEMMQKDRELTQKTVALQPEQLHEPPREVRDETFHFGTEEEDFHAAPLEQTMDIKDFQQKAVPGDDASDDFEFPDLGESRPPLDAFSGDSDDLSSTLAMPGMPEPESASFAPSSLDDGSEDFSDDKTLVNPEISLGDEEVSLQTGEMLRQEGRQKEDTGTLLLRPEEVEDILQSEIPPLDESLGGPAGDRAKTELLGEDELSKVLDELDTDSSEKDHTS